MKSAGPNGKKEQAPGVLFAERVFVPFWFHRSKKRKHRKHKKEAARS